MRWQAAETILCARLGDPAAAWLREALADVRRTSAADPFLSLERYWSGATRRLGKPPLALTDDELARLGERPGAVPADATADEWGRALLLIAALDVSAPDTHVPLVDELFRSGELREQRTILRFLCLLPDAGRFATLAIDAVRSNATLLLEAIACANPYPSEHLPEESFNQMVLKCLFNALPLSQVVGLDRRLHPELVRMVAAYTSERRAAGRTVPEDAMLILKGASHASV